MALASAYGLQYELPQDTSMANMGSQPVRTPGDPEYTSGMGTGDLLSDPLYQKEQATKEYYQKVFALKSFANEVSKRYGYDVTQPNYRDQESIKFHQMYMEALADLRNTQNSLKRLATQEDLSLRSPNVRRGTDESNQDFFYNAGENDMVKSLRDTAGKIKSKEQAEAFGELTNELYNQTLKEMSTSRDPRERAELKATAEMIKNITTDVGMSPYQESNLDLQERKLRSQESYQNRSLALREKEIEARRSGSGARTEGERAAIGRIKTIADIANSAKSGNLGNLGINISKTASGTFLEKEVGGDIVRFKVDPKDPKAFLLSLNGFLNKDSSLKTVGFDDMQNYGIDLSELGQSVISALEPTPDISKNFINNLDRVLDGASSRGDSGELIRSSLSDLLASGRIIPESVAKTMEGGIMKDTEISNIEPTTDGVKISIIDKSGNKEKTTKFSYRDKEDREKIKKIIDFNIEYIPMDKIMQLVPEGQAPTEKSGTENDGISFEDF